MSLLTKPLHKFAAWFEQWHRVSVYVVLGLVVLGVVLRLLRAHAGWPDEIAHLVEEFTLCMAAAVLACWAALAAEVRFSPPPILPGLSGLPEPLYAPPDGHWVFGRVLGRQYRYRYCGPEDIEAVVSASDNDPTIGPSNLELTAASRRTLYMEWYTRNSASFMKLDVKRWGGSQWEPFAWSIVLPITAGGRNALWNRDLAPVELQPEHIVARGDLTRHVLIDELLVPTKEQRGHAGKFVLTLAKLHCSQFGFPSLAEPIEYLVEPDHPKLPRILAAEGFSGPRRIKGDKKLFSLVLPGADSELDGEIQRLSCWRITG